MLPWPLVSLALKGLFDDNSDLFSGDFPNVLHVGIYHLLGKLQLVRIDQRYRFD